MDLLKVASTTYRCPTCNCEEAKAEDTCVAYVAAVVLQCRIPGINQHACVKQELSSGFPTGLVPCSSDAAVCTAIGSFTRKTAETHALICTDEEPSDREGRFLGFGHLGVFIKKITLAMAGANSLAANILTGRDALGDAISCTAPSPPAVKLPCVFPFHQGAEGKQESVNGTLSPVVYNTCSTDDIVAATGIGASGNITVVGQPPLVEALGLGDAPRWCATAVNAAAANATEPLGSSTRGNAAPADRMIRWRYCGACVVV